MGGLLNNARKFFQGVATTTVPPRSQRYSVACPDGHRLSGLRTDGYQALRCPTCGEGIFILPRSPLPDPGDPPDDQVHARPVRPLSVEDEGPVMLTDPVTSSDEPEAAEDTIVWEDEEEETDDGGDVPEPVKAPTGDPFEAAQAELADAPARPRPSRPRPKRDRQAARAQVEDVEVEPAREPFDFGRWVRSNRNLLIASAVVLAIVGSVAVRLRRARLAELPSIAERGRVEGLAALDDGKFDLAYQLLSRARDAVDTLGDDFQGASAIRQGAAEAEVIARQVDPGLEALLDEASRAVPGEWAATFDRSYKGRTVIIEATLDDVPDGRGNGRYALDYVILTDGGDGGPPRSKGRVDTTGFKHLDVLKPRKGDKVIFGARLASFTLDAESETWLVGLEPESGVVMTHHKALEALGFDPPDPEPTGEAP